MRINSSCSGRRQNSSGKQGSQQRGEESTQIKNAAIMIGSNTCGVIGVGGFTTTVKVSKPHPYEERQAQIAKTAFLIPNEKVSSSSSSHQQRAVASKSQQS